MSALENLKNSSSIVPYRLEQPLNDDDDYSDFPLKGPPLSNVIALTGKELDPGATNKFIAGAAAGKLALRFSVDEAKVVDVFYFMSFATDTAMPGRLTALITAKTVSRPASRRTSATSAENSTLARHEVFVAAVHSRVVAYNNLSHVPDWLSDTICVVSEGSGESQRELFTNADESLIVACAPFLITSIENVIRRGDLAQRTLYVHLANVSDKERMTEEEFRLKFSGRTPTSWALCAARSRTDSGPRRR
jgi:hypothetical protein